MTITNWPVNERPREKLLAQGAKNLSDAELLAIFFRTGVRGKSALDIARELIHEFGSLRKMLNTDPQVLRQKPGIGNAKLAMLKAAIELGGRYLEEKIEIGEKLSDSTIAQRFLINRLGAYPHEVFACLFLDNQNRVICFEELAQGTLNEANVYPRELIKRCMNHNAAKIILAHNHPSGNLTPSQADIEVTKLLKTALLHAEVIIVDHVVVGVKGSFSFAEAGLI